MSELVKVWAILTPAARADVSDATLYPRLAPWGYRLTPAVRARLANVETPGPV